MNFEINVVFHIKVTEMACTVVVKFNYITIDFIQRQKKEQSLSNYKWLQVYNVTNAKSSVIRLHSFLEVFNEFVILWNVYESLITSNCFDMK